jgi:hypothetical protein
VTLNVAGTTNRITVNADDIDIASTYVGQTSITTLGTVATGTWNGTAIANANLANSAVTVGTTSISLGASATTLAGLSSVTSTGFTGNLTGTASLATVTDSTAATAFPVVFNDESNALLDDTGTFTYKPSTGTVAATAFTGNVTGDLTGKAATAELAYTVTVTDSTADTAFPVVLHDESNALLDDTGAFTYNPNSSTVTATTFVGALTGNASGTAATVTGATQASITSCANLVTVGTIGTGVWQGTAIDGAYVDIEGTEVSGMDIDVRYHATDPTAAGATVFSSADLNIASGAYYGTNALLAVTALAENSFISVDINGPTSPDSKGLKIWLIGTRT